MKTSNHRKFFPSLLTGAIAASLLLLPPYLPINAAPGGNIQQGDWPCWGGNNGGRDMYSPAKNLPDHFNVGKYKPGSEDVDMATTKNVKWVASLGSQAFGNVVVANGKVFIGTNNEHPRDTNYLGDYSILLCLDEKNGDFLWQLVVPKLASGKVNDWEGLGLLSSPNVEGNRVYVVTSRCEVMCLDTEGQANGNDGPFMDEAQYFAGPGKPPGKIGPKDADIIWRYDMMDELGVFPHNASNCSILIIGDVIYVCTSNGQDWTHKNIPSPNSPSFIALDKKTGKLIAEDDAKIGPHIFHGQWSSPSAGVVNGRPLVFFGGGNGFCYAFDTQPVKEGDSTFLKTYWKYDCNPPERWGTDVSHLYPGPDGPSEVNATPVFYKNRIYVAVGQDPEHGEGVGNLSCIDATKTGDITKTGKIWSYDKIHRSISTVSIDPDTGLLYVGDFSGFVHCLDAETGKLYWTYDMKAHMWGSTLVADGKVYVGDEDGDLVVFAATKGTPIPADKRKPGGAENEPVVLSKTNFGAAIYSTPIVANGNIFVGSQTHLYCLTDESRMPAKSDTTQKIDLNPKKP